MNLTPGYFANLLANLGQGVLAAQPGAQQSGAWGFSEGSIEQAQGLLEQEALERAKKEERRSQRGGILGKIGDVASVASLIPGPHQPFTAAASTVTRGAQAVKDGDLVSGLMAAVQGGAQAAKLADITVAPELIGLEEQAAAMKALEADPAFLTEPGNLAQLQDQYKALAEQAASIPVDGLSPGEQELLKRVVSGSPLAGDAVPYNRRLSQLTYGVMDNLQAMEATRALGGF